MKEAVVTTTHSGGVQFKFPESFKVPEQWKSTNSTARALSVKENMQLEVLPAEGQSPEDV